MKILIKSIFITLIMAGLISCEEILSPIDENLIGDDFATVDPASAEGLLLNAYTGLIGQYQFTCVATDDAVSNQLTNGYRRMATGELTAQFNPASRWSKYEYVFYINKFLPVIDHVKWQEDSVLNELTRRRLKGEALALRALHHFYILEGHAGKDESGELLGIPYYTKSIESDGDFNVPRPSFEATVDSIIADFDSAYTYLPYEYSSNPDDIPAKDTVYDQDAYLTVNSPYYKNRINGKIVRALQGRVKLFAASPAYLNNADVYGEAVGYIAPLIDEISYLPPSDGVEYYESDMDSDNNEVLWRQSVKQFSYLEKSNFPPSLNGNGNVNPSQNLVNAFPMADGYPRGSDASLYVYDPNDPYTNRDPRLKKYILVNGGTLGFNTIYTDHSSELDGVNKESQKSTRTGYYLKKLLRPDVIIPVSGNATIQNHYEVYIRYTELFLIVAEAQNEIGGPDYRADGVFFSARDILRLTRRRALDLFSDPYLEGISNKEEMRELIRNERRLELCFEGFRFWDLRRWDADLDETVYGYYDDGSETGYQQIEVEKRLFEGDKYNYMPIPYSEILKYSELVQNAGW